MFELVILEYFGYKERVKGFHKIDRQVENISTKLNMSLSNTATKSKRESMNKNAVKKTYIAKDIPKLKDEPFVNNHKNFITSIGHELSYYINTDTNTSKDFSTTWEDVSLTLQKSKSFGKELDENKYYKADIDNILSQPSSSEEKISKIFNFVKTQVKWNEYNSIYCSEKLKNIYEERTGNIADINLMLTSMLRYAGFEANPVLVSTINNGIPRFTASTTDFNYVIAAVELENENYILLDATNPYTTYNVIPTKCLNWYGRLVREDGTSAQIDLNPTTLSKDNFIMDIKIDKDGSVTGQMRRQYTNQYAYNYRTSYIATNEDEYINKLENEIGIIIENYKIQNIKNLSKPVVETISFTKQDAVDIINENIYLSPLLFLAQKENPFKQDQKERKLPIDFTFPKSQKYLINIDVPEGYKIDYIPEPIAVGLPDGKAVYKFNIMKTPNETLQIIVNQDFNQSILPKEYYEPLKEYFKNIVQIETDKIVLVKI